MKLLKFHSFAAAAIISGNAFAFAGGELITTTQLDIENAVFEISLNDELELEEVEAIRPFLNITELLKLSLEKDFSTEDSCQVLELK